MASVTRAPGALFGLCLMVASLQVPAAFDRLGLREGGQSASGSNERGISEGKAESICQTVTELTNSGELRAEFPGWTEPTVDDQRNWHRQAPFYGELAGVMSYTLQPGKGVSRLGLVKGSGTCQSYELVELSETLNPESFGFVGVSESAASRDHYLHWAGSAGSDYFAVLEGEPVVVSGHIDAYGVSNLDLVSWFGEGRQRPLCGYGFSGEMHTKVLTSHHDALCDAAATGRVPLVGRPHPQPVPRRVLGRLAAPFPHADSSTMRVDVNSDGRSELLAVIDPAGVDDCGESRSYLIELTPDGREIADSKLNVALADARGRERTFMSTPVKVIEFEGRAYIQGPPPGSDAKSGVCSVWHNQVKVWCEFEPLPQFKVTSRYAKR